MRVVVPFMLHNGVDELRSLRKDTAPQSGGTAVDTSVSFGEWQQGEQTVAGVGVFKGPLSSVLTSYYSSITFINFKAAQLFVLTMEK